jgi:SCF-associated factor 1
MGVSCSQLRRLISSNSDFIFSNKDHGRLGLSTLPRLGVKDGVPFPVELYFPGIRVVSIVAGGM